MQFWKPRETSIDKKMEKFKEKFSKYSYQNDLTDTYKANSTKLTKNFWQKAEIFSLNVRN